MARPHYSIRIRPRTKSTTCIDCGCATARVTGHRNGRPICDVCLLQQEPRLGSLVAAQSTIQTLATASRPGRPAALAVFRILCDHASDLARFFAQSWETANDAEMRLATAHDLSSVEARARTLGGESAARRFEDIGWVERTIRKARARGVNVKGFLLISAIESTGGRIDDPGRRSTFLEDDTTLRFEASRC